MSSSRDKPTLAAVSVLSLVCSCFARLSAKAVFGSCRVLLGVGKFTVVCNRTIPKHAAPCLKVLSCCHPWWRDQISSKSLLDTFKRAGYRTSRCKNLTRQMNDEMKKCICIMWCFDHLD